MKPGDYMRLRREAAGLTIDSIALLCGGGDPKARAEAQNQMRRIENGEGDLTDHHGLLLKLRGVMAFDLEVYEKLVLYAADQELPLPQVCRGCGCSWMDPCADRRTGTCAWADGDPTLCTTCERREAAHA
ncbi:MAG TPA: hypothetical protein VGD10_08225 [Allosphingosinicella sp.]|uniref:hypothetical protein n=1 Tax=Allosphingosinicella sp. TaxID=2823234 RepID=UPI002ED91B56